MSSSSSAFTLPYARAFLESAPKDYDFSAFLEAGESLSRIFQSNPKLRAFMLAPNVPREAKSRALEELSKKSGLDAFGARFLQLLLRNHRLLEAGRVFRALRDLHDARQGILRVQVTVPAPLGREEEKAIQEAIAVRTGKNVRMQIDLDSRLLGGFVARAGSRVFDGSVAAAVRRFQEQAKERTGA
jgi:F-type H+-transporting ATPase subunit delta